MPDLIARIPGVSDMDWRLLQELRPVYVTGAEMDYDTQEFELLVAGFGVPYSLVVERGTHDAVYERRNLTPGKTAQRRQAFFEWQGAGSRYLARYAVWATQEAERLAKLARQKRDDEDWTELKIK